MSPAPEHDRVPAPPPAHADRRATPPLREEGADVVAAASGTPSGSAEGAHAAPLPAPSERGGRFGIPGGLAANGPGRGTGAWASPIALTALLVAVGAVLTVLQKAPCLLRGWGAPNVYLAGCYSDWAALYAGRGFAADAWAPFAPDSTFEYPVLMSVVGSVAAQITHWLPTPANDDGTLVFWLVNLVFAVGLWAAVAVLTVRSAGRRWSDGLMVAVAPGIILAGTINWDLWAVALLAGGMWLLSRGRTGWAGVLIGLGAAMKVYPILLLGPLLILAVRSRRWRPFLTAAGAAVGAWLAVNVPMMVANFQAWQVFFTFSGQRGPGLSSVWHAWDVAAAQLGWARVPEDRLSLLAWGSFAVCCAAIFVLGVLARRTPRLGQLAFLVVAAFVLTNKVYSPQFVIWLIPLLALALPRWRDFWVWQTVEALHFFAVWMYLAKASSGSAPQHSMDDSVYVLAILAHMAAVLWLCARVVREILRPEEDLVRQSHADLPDGDPLAGEFAARGSAGAATRAPAAGRTVPVGAARATVEA